MFPICAQESSRNAACRVHVVPRAGIVSSEGESIASTRRRVAGVRRMCEAWSVRAMMAAVVRMTMVSLVFSCWRRLGFFIGFKLDWEFVHTSSSCLHAVQCEGATMLPSRMDLLTFAQAHSMAVHCSLFQLVPIPCHSYATSLKLHSNGGH